MESTSDSSTPVEQCNKCHSRISLVGHSVENATWQRREMMTQSTITLWFPALQVFTFKKQLTKERKNINPSPSSALKPRQCAFLNSPALLTRAGEAIYLFGTQVAICMILTQVVQSSIQPLPSCWKMLPCTSLKTICVGEGFWLKHLFCGQRAIKGQLAPSSPLLPPLSQYSSCEGLFSVGITGAERIWAIGYMAEKAISVGFIYADLIVSKTVVLQKSTEQVWTIVISSVRHLLQQRKRDLSLR